jgi:predicted 3-demethylubiquinone-9 3-methyltransferase (glyoxalase superfamily)
MAIFKIQSPLKFLYDRAADKSFSALDSAQKVGWTDDRFGESFPLSDP